VQRAAANYAIIIQGYARCGGYLMITYSIIKVLGLEKAKNALLSAFFPAKL
jgi:hypothetical protein